MHTEHGFLLVNATEGGRVGVCESTLNIVSQSQVTLWWMLWRTSSGTPCESQIHTKLKQKFQKLTRR